MLSVRPLPVPIWAHSSHLPARHLAAKPSPCVDVRRRFLLLPAYWGKASGIGGGGNLPFGGAVGGGGGGGGGDGNLPFGGGEGVDGNIIPHGAFKAPLLHKFFSAKAKGKMECQSSSSMHAMNLEGAEASSSDGQNDEKHAVTQNVLNNTMNSTGNYTYKNSGPETVRMRATNSPIHIVKIGITDDENVSDENEKKMKGRRGFSFNIAVASFAYSMALNPYWTFCCSNTPLGIFGTWMDIIPTAHAVVTITSLLLVGVASYFKEGELPDNHGFKFLKIVQFLVVLWLWAATFIPLRVCRCISHSVVWPFAFVALCMIVLSWIAVFQRTEMVIKRIKTMFEKVPQWLRNLGLHECITAKSKTVQEKQRGPNPPMEMV